MSLGSGSNFFLGAASAGAGGYEIERSVRFNSADSAYLNRTPSSAGNRRTFTFSFWVKRGKLPDADQLRIFNCGPYTAGTGYRSFNISFNGKSLWVWDYLNTYNVTLESLSFYRDPSAWYHIAVIVDTTQATSTDRVKIYVNGEAVTGFVANTYPSQNYDMAVGVAEEMRIGTRESKTTQFFDGYLSDFRYLDGVAASIGDLGEFDDNGVWQPIAYAGTYGTNGFHLPFSDNSTAAALGTDSSGNGNDWTVNNITPGPVSSTVAGMAWSTALNTEPTWSSFPSLTTIDTYSLANPTSFTINSLSGIGSNLYFGYWWSSDGVSWTRSGSDAVSPPYTVTTVNRYLRLALAGSTIVTSATAGTETFTSAFVDADSLRDSPTNGTQEDTGAGGEVSGNYCTLNPIAFKENDYGTFSQGNLTFTTSSDAQSVGREGTIAVSSGKWYWELAVDQIGTGTSANQYCAGVVIPGYQSGRQDNALLYRESGSWNNDIGATLNVASPPSYQTGDLIGFALDLDNNKFYVAKNGVWAGSGDPANNTNPSATLPAGLTLTAGLADYWATSIYTFNFGQRAFTFSAPSGFKALCTANLPDPTIADGSTAMDTKLYTGTEATLTISGYNFAPDLVWRKGRQAVGGSITETPNHLLFDTVRGAGKRLISNDTSQEDTGSTTLTAFTSDGFTLGSSTDGNDAPQTYAAWAWDAGTSTVSNTDGSITSTVRANPSAGFSIVSYTGTGANATVGHGLNAAPEFAIFKVRSTTNNWGVYHKSLGATDQIKLNQTSASSSSASFFQNTEPTSSVIYLGADSTANYGSQTMIAYCFAPVEGYSAFGTYTAGGASNFPFVYTGFRPAFILYRYSNVVGNWAMFDSKRNTYNVMDNYLLANSSDAEGSLDVFDFLSNGFKVRSSQPLGNVVIYACFAENPFKTARAR